MPAKEGSRDIVSIRTFAEDFKRAKEARPDAGETHTEAEAIVPHSDVDTIGEAVHEALAHAEITEHVELEAPEKRSYVNPIPKVQPNASVKTSPQQKLKGATLKAPIEEEIQHVGEHYKASFLTAEDEVFDTGDTNTLGDGQIILDKRRRKHRLLPAILTSIKNWFGEKEEIIRESRRPKHTVTDAKARIETIKEARRQSKKAPKTDHDAVIERLKHAERKPVSGTVALKDKAEEPAPQWSYVDEVEGEIEKGLSANPQRLSAEDMFLKASSGQITEIPQEEPSDEVRTLSVEEAPEEIIEPEPSTGETVADEATVVPETLVDEAPTEPEALPEDAPAPKPKPIPEEPANLGGRVLTITEDGEILSEGGYGELREAVTYDEPVPEEPARAPANPNPGYEATLERPAEIPTAERPAVARPLGQARQYARPSESEGRGLLTIVFVVVIVGAILLGVGVSLFWFGGDNVQEESAVVIRVPQLVTAKTQVPLPLTSDRTTFLNQLLDIVVQNPETIQIYPTAPTEEGVVQPAEPSLILSTLAPRAPGTFLRSVTAMTFGGSRAADPFIIMKVTNFDAGFGGMLQWESAISADLAPLFGNPVTSSFDPQARTDTQIRSAFFRDVVSANRSARLLVDGSGKDRLIYAFINQNTILITTNRSAFEILAPLVR